MSCWASGVGGSASASASGSVGSVGVGVGVRAPAPGLPCARAPLLLPARSLGPIAETPQPTWLACGPSLVLLACTRHPTNTCPNPPLPSLRSTKYSGEPPTWTCGLRCGVQGCRRAGWRGRVSPRGEDGRFASLAPHRSHRRKPVSLRPLSSLSLSLSLARARTHLFRQRRGAGIARLLLGLLGLRLGRVLLLHPRRAPKEEEVLCVLLFLALLSFKNSSKRGVLSPLLCWAVSAARVCAGIGLVGVCVAARAIRSRGLTLVFV